ncbi:MAG: fatty acid desaturase [Bernardetiaceae bacterium]
MKTTRDRGVWIALTIIVLWTVSLLLLLHYPLDWRNPLTYLFVLVQAHLYTGLFITAHDAMHHTVSSNGQLNHVIGRICATLFAFNFYDNLYRKHHLHHRFVATEDDPDYHEGGFWVWYFNFAKQYINVWQLLLMSVSFELLSLVFVKANVFLYWALPSVLATFQLFYFGTYLPHRYAPDNRHKSRSQSRNHLLAFLSCYFFGYHYEHHHAPATPWWQLHRLKERLAQEQR